MNATTSAHTFEIGDEIEAGATGSPDWDRGEILDILDDGRAVVAWRGGACKTTEPVERLRPYGGVYRFCGC